MPAAALRAAGVNNVIQQQNYGNEGTSATQLKEQQAQNDILTQQQKMKQNMRSKKKPFTRQQQISCSQQLNVAPPSAKANYLSAKPAPLSAIIPDEYLKDRQKESALQEAKLDKEKKSVIRVSSCDNGRQKTSREKSNKEIVVQPPLINEFSEKKINFEPEVISKNGTILKSKESQLSWTKEIIKEKQLDHHPLYNPLGQISSQQFAMIQKKVNVPPSTAKKSKSGSKSRQKSKKQYSSRQPRHSQNNNDLQVSYDGELELDDCYKWHEQEDEKTFELNNERYSCIDSEHNNNIIPDMQYKLPNFEQKKQRSKSTHIVKTQQSIERRNDELLTHNETKSIDNSKIVTIKLDQPPAQLVPRTCPSKQNGKMIEITNNYLIKPAEQERVITPLPFNGEINEQNSQKLFIKRNQLQIYKKINLTSESDTQISGERDDIAKSPFNIKSQKFQLTNFFLNQKNIQNQNQWQVCKDIYKNPRTSLNQNEFKQNPITINSVIQTERQMNEQNQQNMISVEMKQQFKPINPLCTNRSLHKSENKPQSMKSLKIQVNNQNIAQKSERKGNQSGTVANSGQVSISQGPHKINRSLKNLKQNHLKQTISSQVKKRQNAKIEMSTISNVLIQNPNDIVTFQPQNMTSKEESPQKEIDSPEALYATSLQSILLIKMQDFTSNRKSTKVFSDIFREMVQKMILSPKKESSDNQSINPFPHEIQETINSNQDGQETIPVDSNSVDRMAGVFYQFLKCDDKKVLLKPIHLNLLISILQSKKTVHLPNIRRVVLDFLYNMTETFKQSFKQNDQNSFIDYLLKSDQIIKLIKIHQALLVKVEREESEEGVGATNISFDGRSTVSADGKKQTSGDKGGMKEMRNQPKIKVLNCSDDDIKLKMDRILLSLTCFREVRMGKKIKTPITMKAFNQRLNSVENPPQIGEGSQINYNQVQIMQNFIKIYNKCLKNGLIAYLLQDFISSSVRKQILNKLVNQDIDYLLKIQRMGVANNSQNIERSFEFIRQFINFDRLAQTLRSTKQYEEMIQNLFCNQNQINADEIQEQNQMNNLEQFDKLTGDQLKKHAKKQFIIESQVIGTNSSSVVQSPNKTGSHRMKFHARSLTINNPYGAECAKTESTKIVQNDNSFSSKPADQKVKKYLTENLVEGSRSKSRTYSLNDGNAIDSQQITISINPQKNNNQVAQKSPPKKRHSNFDNNFKVCLDEMQNKNDKIIPSRNQERNMSPLKAQSHFVESKENGKQTPRLSRDHSGRFKTANAQAINKSDKVFLLYKSSFLHKKFESSGLNSTKNKPTRYSVYGGAKIKFSECSPATPVCYPKFKKSQVVQEHSKRQSFINYKQFINDSQKCYSRESDVSFSQNHSKTPQNHIKNVGKPYQNDLVGSVQSGPQGPKVSQGVQQKNGPYEQSCQINNQKNSSHSNKTKPPIHSTSDSKNNDNNGASTDKLLKNKLVEKFYNSQRQSSSVAKDYLKQLYSNDRNGNSGLLSERSKKQVNYQGSKNFRKPTESAKLKVRVVTTPTQLSKVNRGEPGINNYISSAPGSPFKTNTSINMTPQPSSKYLKIYTSAQSRAPPDTTPNNHSYSLKKYDINKYVNQMIQQKKDGFKLQGQMWQGGQKQTGLLYYGRSEQANQS